MHQRLVRVAGLAFLLLPAAAAAQTQTTFSSTTLYLAASDRSTGVVRTLSRAEPTDMLASKDATSVSDGTFQHFPAFTSEEGLSDLGVTVESAFGGAALVHLRSNRLLEHCVDFALEIKAGETLLARSLVSNETLRPRVNQIAIAFEFDGAARQGALTAKNVSLEFSTRLNCGNHATFTLLYDSRRRPSSIRFLECLASDESDEDGNGVPDVCECTDIDGDGFGSPGGRLGACSHPGVPDNCPDVFNPGQEDADADGVGDACAELPVVNPTDDDGDGISNDQDNCRAIANPGQEDENGNGVGDVCECTSPPPGRCIAGGGNKRTDCLLEINTPGPITLNKAGTGVRPVLSCRDGDPACDRDGTPDGICTMGVSLCFANTDPRLGKCTPARVGSFQVRRPRANRGKDFLRRQNAQRLEAMAGGVGLEVKRRRGIVTHASSGLGENSCGPLVELAVATARKGKKAGRRHFVLQAEAVDGRRDRDRFTLVCRASRCGNGTLDAGEQCDDGNQLDGDGCSRVCRLEGSPISAMLSGRPVLLED